MGDSVAYDKIQDNYLENPSEILEALAELKADIRVISYKVSYIEEHLNQMNGKVQKHQTWIDQRQGQLILSVGLVTVGITFGGLLMNLIFKLIGH